ncbi:hypothetical protein [Budvicia aquatica]|uniref:hypothetical protein n=1 Tax=Budvicia aquatica TaxID=82979 RepID=UPI001D0E0C2B|nr:hypothetical protein [Budvicia aquatica]
MNQIAFRDNKALTIDLSKVRYATASASLLLFAIVNRAQLSANSKNAGQNVRVLFPKKNENPEGHRWIVATGLSKALMAGTFRKLDNLTKEGRYFQSSTNPSEHSSATALFLAERAQLTSTQFRLLTSGISEAMLNVHHHAYNSLIFEPDIKVMKGSRWWQCAWFDPSKDKVVFIICDLGMGITRSYCNTLALPQAAERMLELNAVTEAMTQGNTCTGDNGRGNGSEDIKRPIGVGCAKNESLLILTGHTKYHYGSNESQPKTLYQDDEIPGTLVEWSLVPNRGKNDD